MVGEVLWPLTLARGRGGGWWSCPGGGGGPVWGEGWCPPLLGRPPSPCADHLPPVTMWPIPWCIWCHPPPPPIQWQNDRCQWKYNLCSLRYAGGNENGTRMTIGLSPLHTLLKITIEPNFIKIGVGIYIRQCKYTITLPDSDSDSRCIPNGHIVLCRTFMQYEVRFRSPSSMPTTRHQNRDQNRNRNRWM